MILNVLKSTKKRTCQAQSICSEMQAPKMAGCQKQINVFDRNLMESSTRAFKEILTEPGIRVGLGKQNLRKTMFLVQ